MGMVTDRTLSADEFLEECVVFKQEHAPQSVFLRGLVTGKLTDEQVRLWAMDFYHYVEPAIPTIAGWLARVPTLPDRSIYKLIVHNLAGEMGYIREAEHYELYLQFLAGLGVSREQAESHLPAAGTIGAASTMGYYCRNSFEEGLGAFGLAVEMDVPGRPNGAKFLYDGLRQHYGLDDKTLEFWAIHVEAEEEHGENAVQALQRFGQTREQQALIRRAFRFSVIAHAAMSEGYACYLDRPAAGPAARASASEAAAKESAPRERGEPYVLECRLCGKVFESPTRSASCPECDSADVELMG